MQILLIQDVDNLGYAGQVKKVANGYGRNYLLPQGLAILATPGALKQAETIRTVAEKHRAQETADATAIANQLVDLELVFERRAGETGKLYGSVTPNDIAQAIKEKTEIEVDRRKVRLPEPIRNLGEQEVTIKLMIDVSTTIKVEVLPLGGILERERLSAAEIEQIEAEAEAAPEPDEAEVEQIEAVAEAAPERDETEVEQVEAVAETTPEPDETEVEQIEAVAAPEPDEAEVEQIEAVAEAASEPDETEVEQIEAEAEAAPEPDEVEVEQIEADAAPEPDEAQVEQIEAVAEAASEPDETEVEQIEAVAEAAPEPDETEASPEAEQSETKAPAAEEISTKE
jgi:large subunit ribosomal protein L9